MHACAMRRGLGLVEAFLATERGMQCDEVRGRTALWGTRAAVHSHPPQLELGVNLP